MCLFTSALRASVNKSHIPPYTRGGGLIYGWAYTWTIFCVSNKQVGHKQVSHKQGNKRVLTITQRLLGLY